jgi:very-short-patch-repair endonuclease
VAYQPFHPFNNKKLKSRRKELRSQGIAAEAVLWKYLQKRQVGGKKFRRQQSIGPYVVDFYCRECRVIVELDGARHYGQLGEEYEHERTRYLEHEFGMKILRFENRVLYESPEAVLETIKEALLERASK